MRFAQASAVTHAQTRGELKATPVQTVEAVLFGLFGRELKVALIPMSAADQAGCELLMLPGGYVDAGQDVDSEGALKRVLQGLLGLTPRYVEQSFTVAGSSRGTGGWSSSIVHLAMASPESLQELQAAGKISLVSVLPEQELPSNLALDHADLIKQALSRFAAKAAHSSIVSHLLPEVFTLSDLHRAFEVVCQRPSNPANFRRKILEANVLVSADVLHGSGRPAQGYRFEQPLVYFDRQIV